MTTYTIRRRFCALGTHRPAIIVLGLVGCALLATVRGDRRGQLDVPAEPIAAAPAQVTGYAVDAVWPVVGADPLAIAVRADGVSYTVVAPLRTQPDFPALVRRDASGAVDAARVVRDAGGAELRPIAVAVTASDSVFLSTDRKLVLQAADGSVLWDAPAGDPHPDFGPSARSLTLAGDTLYGTDLANARVLGYRVAGGQLRLRLGTPGASPGSFLAPLDVAVGPGGDLRVADFGNRRVQVLDAAGNPVARWPLPGRPRALAVDAGGQTFVLLDGDEVIVLGPTGTPLLRFGRPGRGSGELQLANDLALGPGGRVFVVDRGNRRIQVFRPVDAVPPTATPDGIPPSPTPSAPPERRSVQACPDRPARLTWDVHLSPAAPRADVMLVIDTTGSMESLISTAQTRAQEIASTLRGVSPDVAIGVLDARDYPYGQAGLASDWPWHLRGPLSTDPDDLATATGELAAGGGGDAPEAYSGAIAAALDDPRAGWRAGARRFVVLLGDSVPRDNNLNEGIASPRVPGVWIPGTPAWWRDSGADWAPGSADDLDWGQLLARLERENVTLFAGISGAAPPQLGGQTADLVDYWRAWAARTAPGGDAVDLSNVSQLPQSLGALLARSGRRIARLVAVVDPPGSSAWVTFTPSEHKDVDVPPFGALRTFDVTLAPPASVPDGTYTLLLEALGDGGRYGALEVMLDWRASCAVTPTPPEATPTAVATHTASVTPSPTATATPTPSPTVTASPSASPTPTRTPATRRIHLPLAMRGFCFAATRPRADIVLVLDTSNSMAGAKLEAARGAALAFVDLVNLPRDRAAIVTFNQRPRLDAGLTGNRGTLQVALATLTIDQGTRIDLGLAAALDELRSPRARADARPVIVLLTDGRPDAGTAAEVLATASRARAAGVTIFTIGLGGDVDGALLAGVAGDPGRYAFAPDAGALAEIYRRIAGGIPCQ